MEEIRAKIDSLDKRLNDHVMAVDNAVRELRGSVAEVVALKNSLVPFAQIQTHLNQQDNDRKEDQKNLMLILNGDNTDPVARPGLMGRVSKLENFQTNTKWVVGLIVVAILTLLGDLVERFITGKK